MINSIIEAISIAINNEFGDEYINYTEEVKQGLKEPCFFISCIKPANTLFLGKRYFRENKFCIQYFPSDKAFGKEECNAAAQRLFSCLEYIDVGGDLVRGSDMSCETADGILNFFINYDFFVYQKSPESYPMQEVSGNITLKGDD